MRLKFSNGVRCRQKKGANERIAENRLKRSKTKTFTLKKFKFLIKTKNTHNVQFEMNSIPSTKTIGKNNAHDANTNERQREKEEKNR